MAAAAVLGDATAGVLHVPELAFERPLEDAFAAWRSGAERLQHALAEADEDSLGRMFSAPWEPEDPAPAWWFASVLGRELPTAVVPAPSNVRLGRQALDALLQQEPALEAVFCSSDALAEGVMTEARVRGLRVPEDLAVCGFGDADFAACLAPALTTVQIDGAAIGRLAAEAIVERCARGAAAPGNRIVDVGFKIVERQSTLRGGA